MELRDRETVKPLELFFDLVFVLGFTQCTALMAAQPTWAGVGRGLLVLAVIWWAWVCYAWLTNLIEPEEGAVRLAMFGAMVALLVVALCIPEAFGDRALAFAVAYGVVRVGHLVLYLLAARDRPSLRRWLLGYAGSTTAVIGLLVGASFADGALQVAIWCAVIALDWVVPAVSGVEHWQLVPGHFAERHNLVIILATPSPSSADLPSTSSPTSYFASATPTRSAQPASAPRSSCSHSSRRRYRWTPSPPSSRPTSCCGR
jgi:low temperature requirement protein LtrA